MTTHSMAEEVLGTRSTLRPNPTATLRRPAPDSFLVRGLRRTSSGASAAWRRVRAAWNAGAVLDSRLEQVREDARQMFYAQGGGRR